MVCKTRQFGVHLWNKGHLYNSQAIDVTLLPQSQYRCTYRRRSSKSWSVSASLMRHDTWQSLKQKLFSEISGPSAWTCRASCSTNLHVPWHATMCKQHCRYPADTSIAWQFCWLSAGILISCPAIYVYSMCQTQQLSKVALDDVQPPWFRLSIVAEYHMGLM